MQISTISNIIFYILIILFSLFVVGVFVFFLGYNPFYAIWILISGSLGSANAISYTLYYTTNFIFAAIAVAIPFKAGMFNIGGEGQAYIAGLASAAYILAFDNVIPAYFLIPTAIIVAMIAGGLWAAIAGLLKAFRGSHEVITTIMLNFVASGFAIWIINNYLRSGYGVQTRQFSHRAIIPTFSDVLNSMGFHVNFSPLNFSVFLAILALILFWIYVNKTSGGFDLRILGTSKSVTKYIGFNQKGKIVFAMLISGMVIGLLPVNQLMGYQHRLFAGFVSGVGFTGIAVSIMGMGSPIGILLSALLFGALQQGGVILSYSIPGISSDMAVVIQGIIIFSSSLITYNKNNNIFKFLLLRKKWK